MATIALASGIEERVQQPSQVTLFFRQIRAFVGHVVYQPHECIQRHDGVALRLRQQKECWIKIAVRIARYAMAFLV